MGPRARGSPAVLALRLARFAFAQRTQQEEKCPDKRFDYLMSCQKAVTTVPTFVLSGAVCNDFALSLHNLFVVLALPLHRLFFRSFRVPCVQDVFFFEHM